MAVNVPVPMVTAGILLVTARRDDRRVLFDVLDSQGYACIYAARDAAQARALLAEKPAIALVLVEFNGEAQDALAFCAELHDLAAYRHTPVLGLVDRHAGPKAWHGQHPPRGVNEWVCTPVDADEVLVKVKSMLEHPARVDGPVRLPTGTARPDYRFAFDNDEDGWIVSAADGTVIEVNAAFAHHVRLPEDSLCGQPLTTLLGEGETALATLRRSLEIDDSLERMVRCPRGDGSTELMRATTRRTMHNGWPVHVTALQPYGQIAQGRAMLNLLARLRKTGSGDTGVREGAHLIVKALQLDFLGVYAAMPEANGEPTTWAEELREPPDQDAAVPDVLQQPVLKLVLDGQSLVDSSDAQRLLAGADAFVAAMGFSAFAGLPLADERSNVLGALLAGSREPWDAHSLIPETLRAATMHFAGEMELKRTRQQGRARGLLDGLTRLPNRLLFNDRLETTLREAHRTGEMFAVLFVDLDRFKSINDSLGHSVGDEVLTAVSRRLRGSVRSSDTVARYAGDEFTIILRHITQRDDVLRIADKIVRLMDAPLMLVDGSELHITASIGISFFPDDANSGEQLLKHADVAMYNAKGKGRNGYQVYVATPDKSHQQRVALETKLRQAERNGELRVFYQPQVDCVTEDIVGMEALVRWEHPELGMISPGFFIPLAEETGLIVGIGEWVLRRACEAAARWQKRYGMPLRVGVNLSALQLMQPNIAEVVRSALIESDLPPASLELEVTESISVKSVPHLLEKLRTLHGIGCLLAIDDFGTGQSSLDYLRNLPADRIKIDQSFVRNIGVDPDDEAIVKATINMVHSLNRAVVAEGVETEVHLGFLREQQCDELQGYLFSRPLARNAFDSLLGERQRLLARGGGAP